MADHNISNLVARYNGGPTGIFHEPDEPGLGGWRYKANGDIFRADIAFYYSGIGGWLDVGIGLDYQPAPTWAWTSIFVAASGGKWVGAEVAGYWNCNIDPGAGVYVLKFVQLEGGPRDIGGNNFIRADWDRGVLGGSPGVYINVAHEADIIDDPTRTYYDGKALSTPGWPLPKENGEEFSVKFPFKYRGPGGVIQLAAGLDYSPGPTFVSELMDMPASAEYVEYWAGPLVGIFNTSEDFGDQITVVKIITNEGAALDLDGHPAPILPVANTDIDVFYRTRPQDEHDVDVIDGTTYYSRNGETPVHQDVAAGNPLLGMRNGDTWGVDFQIIHKGPAGSVVAGIKLDTPQTVRKTISVNEDPGEAVYDVFISGIWNTDLPHDRDVDAYKFVELIDGTKYTENSDVRVFNTIVDQCDASNPCPSGYECVNGVCVPKTVECTVDSDCAEGEICVGGYCFEDTGGEFNLLEWIKENALVISAVGIAAAGALVVTSKPKKK